MHLDLNIVRFFRGVRYFDLLAMVPGILFPGFSIFFILSYILTPYEISVPLSIIVSSLVLILSCHYRRPFSDNIDTKNNNPGTSPIKINIDENQHKNKITIDKSISYFVYVVIYSVSIIYISHFSQPNFELFVQWHEFNPINILYLFFAVSLSLFLPGYTLVTIILGRRKKLDKIFKYILYYLFSILINGLIVYGLSTFGLPVSQSIVTFAIIHLIILLLYIVLKHNDLKKSVESLSYFAQDIKLLWKFILSNKIYIIAFACFVSLVFYFVLYLFNGTIVSDQWFHHGRALILMNGEFKNLAKSGLDWLYPPFFSSLLSSFFTFSDIPSVNAYVFLGFLNIMPVLAFYYFFTKWVPPRWKKASLLAASLFILGGGFGWIHVLDISLNDPDYGSHSPTAVMDSLKSAGVKGLDVFLQPSFGIASRHPDQTTGLIIISLPAGFALLTILKIRSLNNIQFFSIIFLIALIGILTHDEFFLFIIIASTLPIFFMRYLQSVNNFNYMYLAILTSIVATIFVDFLLPDKYYTIRDISGIPIIYLVLTYVSIMGFLYLCKVIEKLISRIKILFSISSLSENKSKQNYDNFVDTHTYYDINRPKRDRKHNNLSGRKYNSFINKSVVRHSLLLFVVAAIAYLYLFSLIVWSELGVDEVALHISNVGKIDIPWYLFPIRFGLIGLFGIAFLLSYLFKRFEKEVFIFGIIAAAAFIIGPYYDEFRFSKYVMVGLTGFASIFVYMLISYLSRKIKNSRLRIFSTSMLIGTVITVSSISLSMFAAYNTLALDNPKYNSPPGRLDFPSNGEINMFKFILNNQNTSNNSHQSYNIVSVANETDLYYGLLSKFEGFAGLPRTKIIQNPLILNASSLEELYSSLYYGDVKLIVMPKKYVTHSVVSFPIKFVLSSFQRVYEDKEFIVLNVPDLRPPLKKQQEVALVHTNSETMGDQFPDNIDFLNQKFLKYDRNVFYGLPNDRTLQIKGNGSSAVFLSEQMDKTLWTNSNIIEKNDSINYVESTFKFDGKNTSAGNAEIIVGTHNDKEYSVILRAKSLNLSETKTAGSQKVKVMLANSTEIIREKSVWYTLKVLVSGNMISVYLDDALKLKVKANSMESANASLSNSISKIGLRSAKNTLEFKPIILGYIQEDKVDQIQEEHRTKNLHYYYLISGLAFSKQPFDTFLSNDYSIFSKKKVILNYDSFSNNIGNLDYNKYLDYVYSGGTLVITMNATNDNIKNFNNTFGKLLQISSQNNSISFASIANQDNSSYINISGTVKSMNTTNSSSLGSISVISSYMDENNRPVAPLAIKKDICVNGDDNKCGRIVVVNIGGYFGSISKSPEKYFSTLASFGNIIGIKTEEFEYLGDSPNTSLPFMRIGGPIKIDGLTTISTNSLLLPALRQDKNQSQFESDDVRIEKIFVTSPESNRQTLLYKDVVVKNLHMYGLYNASIDTHRSINFDPSYSRNNYAGISIPDGFNMTINLLQKNSKVEINSEELDFNNEGRAIKTVNGDNEIKGTYIDSSDDDPYLFTLNNSEIYFNNVKSISNDVKSISFMMKQPKIEAQGDIHFRKLYPIIVNKPYSIGTNDRTVKIENGLNEGNPSSSGVNISLTDSNVTLQINNINPFYEPYSRVTLKHITYISSSDINGNLKTDEKKGSIEIMGDISQRAKDRGQSIPLLENFISFTSIAILIIIIATMTMIGKVLYSRTNIK